MSETAQRDPFAPRPARDVPSWDAVCDVAVVGLGVAGACAAIEAAAAGADVLALERASGGGGTSAASGGLLYLGGGTPVQRALGFEDSAEEMFKYLMAACGPDPDPALVEPYCAGSVEHFRWLAAQGVAFGERFFPGAHEPPGDDGLTYSGSEDVHPFCTIARPAPRGHCPKVVGPKGALLMRALLASVERARVRVATGARAERLVVESDGRVCGVEARVAREPLRVRARRGVVLASGGFIYDEASVARHAPWLLRCRAKTGTESDDGSGIWMGVAAGGAAIRMNAGDITLPIFPPVVLKQGLFVNAQAQRFLNEDAYFGRSGEFALLRQDGQVYLVVDEGCFERPALFPAELAGTGETIAELEGEIGLPKGALERTLEYYNLHAAQGLDPLFHKGRAHLRPLDRPPFAAFDLRPERFVYSAFTLGGLQIDADAAVLSQAGLRVPGLFAAGRTTSGLSKQGYSSGISLGDGSFFGRRAGRSAARGG